MKNKCSICKKNEGIWRAGDSLKRYCGPECGAILALQLKAKLDKARLEETNKEFRRRKDALLTVSDWTKKAQEKSFNPYIRLRDIKKPCISCGRYDHEIEEGLRGGKWDAGHYRSRGACPELRFEPLNCHKQCKACNGGSGKYAKKNDTVQKQYRVNLIERIGIEKVEWIDGPHQIPRYRIEDLKQIYDKFKRLTKELKHEKNH